MNGWKKRSNVQTYIYSFKLIYWASNVKNYLKLHYKKKCEDCKVKLNLEGCKGENNKDISKNKSENQAYERKYGLIRQWLVSLKRLLRMTYCY